MLGFFQTRRFRGGRYGGSGDGNAEGVEVAAQPTLIRIADLTAALQHALKEPDAERLMTSHLACELRALRARLDAELQRQAAPR